MSKNVVIKVDHVSKSFTLPHEKNSTLKQAALGLLRKKTYSRFEVLKDVSFDIHEGDFFGIIGRNGSGKSTLLKMLAGIYKPNAGKITINGKISPFLELGVGFNPELSGWENIYLNGALLGLTRKEIAAKIDEIVDFTELREFMDQKLKNYSSGMQVRLAFSVAIHAHAPIILLDEVLAVGDSNFQRKCFDVFTKLKEENRTIVFVTHSMDYVRKFCNRAVLIHKGKIRVEGDVNRVADEYEKLNIKATNNERAQKTYRSKNEWGDKEVEITSVDFFVKGKKVDAIFKPDSSFEIAVNFKNNSAKTMPVNAAIGVYTGLTKCFDTNTHLSGAGIEITKNEKSSLTLMINELNMLPGDYSINVSISSDQDGYKYHSIMGICEVSVSGEVDATGIVMPRFKWIS
jgi:ABC-type polysaccharide/polyol phosphate transport system ATPase subunit